MKRLILGITGGIATGKTSVLRILARKGIPTISADDLAHTCIRKGKPAYRSIVRIFGKEVLGRRREIERRKLGEIVFCDSVMRKKLESIIHPYVAQGLRKFIRAHHGLMALDIPLLFEAKYQSWVDKIVVVYCSKAQQIKRFTSRTGLSRAQALRRIRAQWPLSIKCRRANIVLDNSGTASSLKRQIQKKLLTCGWFHV